MKLVLGLFSLGVALNSVGWVLQDNGCGDKMNVTNYPWDYYTHIVTSSPVVLLNGTTICNSSDTFLSSWLNAIRSRGKKFIWRDGMGTDPLTNVIYNPTWTTFRANYLASINATMIACGLLDDSLSGMEIDYEPLSFGDSGYISAANATIYGQFMRDLRAAIGPKRSLGFDMGVLGITDGSYPGMVRPWIDVTTINSPVIDYVNAMSYHWYALGSVLPWQKDMVVYSLWGITSNKINIGIPYFNLNGSLGIYGEPLWCNLSDDCPNIPLTTYVCNGITIVSKQQNYNIGVLARTGGYGGIFPWAGNYDTLTNDNNLAKWAWTGLTGSGGI